MSRNVWLLFVAGFTLWMPALLSQSAGTGGLTGTVTDPSGAVVPNVNVTLTSADTNQVRTAITSSDGTYKFSLLPPGTYNVRFSGSGFKASEISGVVINVTETPVVDRALEVGAQSDQITVEAAVETLQTASSTLGTTVGSETATALPLTNRNYTQIVSLSSGANVSVNNAAIFGKASQDVSVNGANVNQNNYQMDGVNIINFAGTGTGADSGIYAGIGIPNPDALQEFKIQTSTYDASYGRNPGANVNVVTRSGTNAVHGSLFEFFRNKDLNANDFFRNRNCALSPGALALCQEAGGVKQTLNQNQFGGTVGMPIKKDKMFFFFSYQETRERTGASSQGYASPNLPALPLGDRSNTAAFTAALGAMWCKGPSPSVPNSIKVACDGSNINPVAIAILQLKLPNGNYYIPASGATSVVGSGLTAKSFSIPAQFTEHQAVANYDYLLNSKHTLSARFFTSQDPETIPFTNANGELAGTPASYLYANTDAVLKLTSILTNSLVNEARGSYQRNITANKDGDPFTATQVGMTPINPAINIFQPITINGAFNMGGGISDDVFTPTNQFQESDMLSWSHGKNTMRFGFEFEHVQWDQGFKGIERGGTTINSFADFLIGRAGCPAALLSTGACGPGDPGVYNGGSLSNISSCTFCVRSGPTGIIHGYRINDINWFAQDDVKVNSKLTLNMGLRWEYDGTLSDVYGNLTNLWTSLLTSAPVPGVKPAAGDLNPGAAYLTGYVVPANFASHYGTPPAGVFQSNRILPVQSGPPLNNFAPRFGFAYQALTHLVIRGGVGMFYDRVGGNQFVHSVEQGNPYAVTLDFSGSGNQPSSLQQLLPNTPLSFVPRWANLSNLTYSGLNLPFIDQTIHTPLTRQYNLNIQYEFVRNWVLELGFVGSSGINQADYNHNINPAQLASPANPVNGITTNTVSNVNFRVPYLGFQPAGLQETSFDGVYNYNSFQATVRKSLSHGVTLQAAYTFSKNLTDLEGFGANWNDPTSLWQQYGTAYFNRPQRLAFNYNWQLPGHANGVLGAIANGWAFSGVTTVQSGTPLTFTDARAGSIYGLSGNNSGTTPTALGAVSFGAINYGRAQIAPGATYGEIESSGGVESRLGGASGGTGFFDTAAFAPPPVIGNGTGFGDSGVGIARGPGQFNFDMSLVKTTRVGGIRENAILQFRAESYNIANHPQFNNPGTSITAATFGVITSTSVNPRLIQFALKYIF